MPTLPKPRPITPAYTGIGVAHPLGYAGGGYNYPQSSLGGSVVNYSTTPGQGPTVVGPATNYNPFGTNTPAGAPALPAPDQNVNVNVKPYLGELTSDPIYQQGLKSYQDALTGNRNLLTNQLRQAIVQGGWGVGGGPQQVNVSN